MMTEPEPLDVAQIRAGLAAADQLPYGEERIMRREDLIALAERCGDPATLASALLGLADDCQEIGENQGMVVGFGRAWRIWQTRPESFDADLRFRFREHFQHVVDYLAEDPRVPAAEVDRLAAEMEAFYRSNGYSLRAVHRSRYWIHRRRGETEQATRCIEALLAEDGDAGASCDACDLATAAYWYEQLDDLPRAIELWRAVVAGARSCDRPHVGIAHGELMIDLLNLERFDEARRHQRLGYPAIRRRTDQPRQLELHMLFVNRTRDMLRGLEILHDHVDRLPADRHAVGESWWAYGRILVFLRLLINEGHGDLPVTRSARDVVTVSRLCADLDAVLADYAAHRDHEAGGPEHAETLESWRTAKLRHDEPPPADGDAESGWAPIAAPWDSANPAEPGAARTLPNGVGPVDALAARARYLSFLRHPHACAAWERVAACDVPLSEDVEAELAESRAVALARRADHDAAHQRLEFAATLYAALGRGGDALRCRAMAAYELYSTREADDASATAQAEARAAAEAEYQAGRISATQLVTVRLYGLYQHLDRWRRVVDAEPGVAHDDETSRLVSETGSQEFRAFRELAERHGATPQYAAALRAWAEVTAAIARMFAREGAHAEAADYTSSLLDRLSSVAELYAGVFQPWFAAEAELRRGQAFLVCGRPEDAERCARRAAALNSPPVAEDLIGPTALLLGEALNAQGERDEQVAAAAANAAGALAGVDPVGAARARLLMAQVHHRAQRHAQAVSFYHPALAEIAGRWQDETCRQLIHLGALHYATSLCALGRPRDAARVLRSVLAFVPDEYASARAWLLYQLAESIEQDGSAGAAVEAYRAAAQTGRRAREHQPATAALESAARLLAPADVRDALECLQEAIVCLGEMEHEPDTPGARRRDFLIARARTLGLQYVVDRIEAETLSDEEAGELVPAAHAAAEAGARALWGMLDEPRDGDAREEFVAALEASLKSLTLTIAVFDENPDAAAEWQTAFAAACEHWGFPEYARTARGNAEYFASRAHEDEQDGDEPV